MDIRHPQWRNELDSTKYPFSQTASLINNAGDVIFETTFIDAIFYPIGGSVGLYLSSVVVTVEEVTIYIGDATRPNIASTTFNRSVPPASLRFTDSFGRPAGLVVSESLRLSIFGAWSVGEHKFTTKQTPFVARCCCPTPEVGVRGFQLDDGSIAANDAWFVGSDGVVLSCEDKTLVTECGQESLSVKSIRVDIIGDPLFRRRLCSQPDVFETPRFIQKITFCTPGAFASSSSSESLYDSSVAGENSPSKVDLLILSDTTLSIDPFIAKIKVLFSGLASHLTSDFPTTNFHWAVANYRDFGDGAPFGPPPEAGYVKGASFSASVTNAQTAINHWSASGGGDGPEEQLYTLSQISTHWYSDFGGRTDAFKIIVWGGDAPGHNSGDYPTVNDTIVALQDKDIAVITVNVRDANDGIDFGGQASDIAVATQGRSINNASEATAAELESLIRSALNQAISESQVAHKSVKKYHRFPPTSQQCLTCGPGQFGDVKISVDNRTANGTDTILRIRPIEEGLIIESVGETLENVR